MIKKSLFLVASITFLLIACGEEEKTPASGSENSQSNDIERPGLSNTTTHTEIMPGADTSSVKDNNLAESPGTGNLIGGNGEVPEKVVIEPTGPDAGDTPGSDGLETPIGLETVPVKEEPTEKPTKDVATPKPNHAIWDGLLKKHVSSSGSVNYGALKSSLGDIEDYIDQLESLDNQADWSRNEKLAYWINLYNAVTVRLILKNYPVSSITKLHGGKPWNQKLVTIGGKSYSLDEIENKIIRPRFKEPRIHFAVNCAAKSCPKLMNGAFIANSLNSQLDKMTKSFINGDKNELSEKKIEISKIFEWYKEDFTSNGTLIDYLNKYANVQIKANAKVTFAEYDWQLNK